MTPEEIDDQLKSFVCQRCNECCKKPGFVYLKEGEAESIAGYLKTDLYTFTDAYCDVVDRQRLVLKKNKDESCVFLTENGCSIHEQKPQQCRDFPIRWRTENSFEYCEGLKKIFGSEPDA